MIRIDSKTKVSKAKSSKPHPRGEAVRWWLGRVLGRVLWRLRATPMQFALVDGRVSIPTSEGLEAGYYAGH